jgi:ubiquinone/menaquinone biosynthesis C-methylase UbiE
MIALAPRTVATLALLAALMLAGCGASSPPPQPSPAHGDGMPHRFEHAEQWAKEFDAPERDAWQRPDDVIAVLALTPRMAVADVGAGTGYFTMRIARAVPQGEVVATDVEPDMVRYLGERAAREQLGNVRAVLATGDDPKLEPASVDRILVVDVWHHVADRRRYAIGLARALRPGGMIAIVDFTSTATRGPPQHHRLAPQTVIADLAAGGLAATVSPTTLPEQYIVIATKPVN